MNEVDFLVSAVAQKIRKALKYKFHTKREELLSDIIIFARNSDIENVLSSAKELEAYRGAGGEFSDSFLDREAAEWANRIRHAIELGTLREELDEFRREGVRMDIEPMLFIQFRRLTNAILEEEGAAFRPHIELTSDGEEGWEADDDIDDDAD